METDRQVLRLILAGVYLTIVMLGTGFVLTYCCPPYGLWPKLLWGTIAFAVFISSQTALVFGLGLCNPPIPIYRRLLPAVIAGVMLTLVVLSLGLCVEVYTCLSVVFDSVSPWFYAGLNLLFWSVLFLLVTRKVGRRQVIWRLFTFVAVACAVDLLCAIPARVVETELTLVPIDSAVAVFFGVIVMLWTLGAGLGLLLTSARWMNMTEATPPIQHWQWLVLAVFLVLLSALAVWLGLVINLRL